MKSGTTWREKLTNGRNLPKVVPVPESMIGKWGTSSNTRPKFAGTDR